MDKKNKLNKTILFISIFIVIIITLIVLFFIILNEDEPNNCDSFSLENCPGACSICPPCEVCSSLSCKSVEFCEGIGYNKSWYEEVKP